MYGEKEWINTQKRKPYERRVWRKLHIAINGTGVIRASQMTSHKINDRACFSSLVDAVGSGFINETLADSGYGDQVKVRGHGCWIENLHGLSSKILPFTIVSGS